MSDATEPDAFPTVSADAAGARWNHNIHYGRQLLELVPNGVRHAVDVGCGEGWLVRELRTKVPQVVGIDPDAFSIVAACASSDTDGIEFLQGDFLTYPFEPCSFDVITAVASLHHMDEEAALGRMAELLRPGGLLGVVGLARTRSAEDLAFDVAGAFVTRFHKLTKTYCETPAPKAWAPPHVYGEVRRFSARVVPNRAFRRRVMWRYTLTWTKPPT